MTQAVVRLLCIFTFVFALGAHVAAQKRAEASQDDAVRLSAEMVVLTASVFDKSGGIVRGLKETDFVIFDNGQPQQFESYGSRQSPFAVSILLDSSASMSSKLSLARAAAAKFAESLRPDDVLSVWSFADNFKCISEFTPDHSIPEAMWDIESAGYTRLLDCAMAALNDIANRPERRRAMIIISDGMDNRSAKTPENVTERAMQLGVTIYAVDLTSEQPIDASASETIIGRLVLRGFANKTGGRHLLTPGGVHVQKAFDQIIDELGSQYSFSYYPSSKLVPGQWRKITVRLRNPDLTVRARDGYTVPKEISKRP